MTMIILLFILNISSWDLFNVSIDSVDVGNLKKNECKEIALTIEKTDDVYLTFTFEPKSKETFCAKIDTNKDTIAISDDTTIYEIE